MEITRATGTRSTAHSWDMEMIIVAILAGLALVALTVAAQRYSPEPLDAEAGWFLCP
ncbi:MAG TPA: hypothetical protein VJ747_07560 [Stellaceae bacterium]|nr:hypothetical protein [Stellaceae bacterium]